MRIAFLIFDNLTTLDAIGPFEVLCRIPGAEVMFVGETAGIKRADPKSLGHGRRLLDCGRDQRRHPGRAGRAGRATGPRETSHARVGAANRCDYAVDDVGLHGSVGARRGRPSEGTAGDDALGAAREVARVRRRAAVQRIVEDGKIITAAGVSAGIDMALHLVRRVAGDTIAHAIQVGIEYDPQPPFDGNAGRAPAHVMEVLRPRYQRLRDEIRVEVRVESRRDLLSGASNEVRTWVIRAARRHYYDQCRRPGDFVPVLIKKNMARAPRLSGLIGLVRAHLRANTTTVHRAQLAFAGGAVPVTGTCT